jgi:hypothetical protein
MNHRHPAAGVVCTNYLDSALAGAPVPRGGTGNCRRDGGAKLATR